MGGFFRKEINTVDDLKGLKFRIGGMGGQVLAKLGVVPQQIAGGDVYPALERGTIDAAEFVGPYDDEKLGFRRSRSTTTTPAGGRAARCCTSSSTRTKWNELPKHYQAIVPQAGEAANNWMLAKYDAVNAPALRRLVGAGAELRAFPLPIMEAALKAANELYAELSAKNADFKKAYKSMVAYRDEVLPWWQLNEYAFDTFMIRTRGGRNPPRRRLEPLLHASACVMRGPSGWTSFGYRRDLEQRGARIRRPRWLLPLPGCHRISRHQGVLDPTDFRAVYLLMPPI